MLEAHKKLILQIVCAVLVDFENNNLLWVEICNLTAELRSDGAASSGYQNRFSLEITADFLNIQMNFVTPQQIQNINVPDRRASFHLIVIL